MSDYKLIDSSSFSYVDVLMIDVLLKRHSICGGFNVILHYIAN